MDIISAVEDALRLLETWFFAECAACDASFLKKKTVSGVPCVISSPVAPDLYNGGVVKGRARSNHYGQTSGY